MPNAVSTAGMSIGWCAESSAGVRPTSGYTVIPGCKAIPAIANEPNTLQSTPLSAEKVHTYILGLSDPGGATAITVNDYEAFRDGWDDCLSAYNTAKASGLGMWFEIAYPRGSGLDSFYFPAEPVPLGFGGAEVDSVLENNMNVLVQGDYEFAAASAVVSG